MNRRELVAVLERAGLNPTRYRVEGVHDAFRGDNSHYLRQVPGGWEWGYSERGSDWPAAVVATEEEACAAVLAEIRRVRPDLALPPGEDG